MMYNYTILMPMPNSGFDLRCMNGFLEMLGSRRWYNIHYISWTDSRKAIVQYWPIYLGCMLRRLPELYVIPSTCQMYKPDKAITFPCKWCPFVKLAYVKYKHAFLKKFFPRSRTLIRRVETPLDKVSLVCAKEIYNIIYNIWITSFSLVIMN